MGPVKIVLVVEHESEAYLVREALRKTGSSGCEVEVVDCRASLPVSGGPAETKPLRCSIVPHDTWRLLQRAAQNSQELERKLGAEALLVERLKDVERMKAEFVETVTHELRTPMTPLRSAIEMFLDGILGALTDDQRQMLEMMNRNVQRLARFATDVLALSRLDSGTHPLEPRSLRLAEAVRPVVELLRPKAAEKRVFVNLEVSDGAGAFADQDALSQVVTNLVDNAISHTPDGTTITVSTRPGGRDFVEVMVADDGQGIPPHAIRRLFDRFYQADRKAGPGYRGTGIGLAVSKALVERMGGRISVDSRVGKGTVFKFTLPTDRLSHEILFGRIAYGLGHVTKEQLREAIAMQHTAEGMLKKMGDLLVERGDLTPEQCDEVLHTQQQNLTAPHPFVPGASVGAALLGLAAVREGLVTNEELNEAVRTQQKLKEVGEETRLGEILAGIAGVSVEEIVGLLAAQNRRIAMCRECGSRFNAGWHPDGPSPLCPRCGAALELLEETDEVAVDGDVE